MFNQALGAVVVLTLLSLEIPNRSTREDEPHQKNVHQFQKTGHLVSLEQETCIWSFCALMAFCAPSDLSTPAPHPCLYSEMLGLAGGSISSPKAPNLLGAYFHSRLFQLCFWWREKFILENSLACAQQSAPAAVPRWLVPTPQRWIQVQIWQDTYKWQGQK